MPSGARVTPTQYPFFHGVRAYELAAWGGARAPRALCRAVAGTIGAAYALTRPDRVAVVRENLRLIRPAGVSARAARRVFREFAATLGDYFYLARRPPAAARGLVVERAGFEHFETIRRHGRGGLLLTPHLSFFELGGAAARDLGLEIVALTRPESSPALTAWRAATRARWGMETIEIATEDQFAFLEVVRHLDAGKLVAALVDRPNATKTHRVRLPGGAADFAGAILLLALAQKCPVLPVTTVRLSSGGYRVEAHAPFFVERGEGFLEAGCQRLADTFAPVLAAHPEQWFHFVPLTASLTS